MPVYEYRCGRGHEYEKVEGFEAPAEHPCPHCGGSSRRQLSLPAVIFKGPGFYSTDNRRGYTGGNGGDSGDTAKEEHGPAHASGGDSKAEAAAD